MNCKKCGSPLPSEGAYCRFCGIAMDSNQLKYQQKMKNNNDQRITLLSEKYGQENKIEYRNVKENKLLGLIFISFILIVLIILTILLNI